MSLPVRRNTEVLRAYMPVSGERILDIGCGKGALVGWFRKHGAEAIGIDPQFSLLTTGNLAAASENLPFDDKSFDSVLFFNSLHHVPIDSLELALAEAARTARARVVVVEPVASGSHFELVKPIDDETKVRAAAYKALSMASSLEIVAEYHWSLEVVEKSVQDVIDGLIAVDPARRVKIDENHGELERRFHDLGRRTDRGMSFDQPMRLNILQHQGKSSRIA